MARPIVVGAVLYDPKVCLIWDKIANYMKSRGVPIDMVFYTNYERQVEGLVIGHLDVAWNSPLAWLDTVRRTQNNCRAIAMRDTDCGRKSHFVVRKGSGIQKMEDLRGKTVAMGASDSPQALMIPMRWLARHGLQPDRDFTCRRFDKLVGLHGDHIGGELDAFRSLADRQVDASVMLDLNWDAWTRDGTVDPEQFEILDTTQDFDHCVFSVREDFPKEREEEFLQALFSMSYDDPEHREIMDMEGLTQWVPGRTSGFDILSEAVEEQAFFDANT